MRTGRLGGCHASLPATAAAGAAVADVAVWQETTASWPSIGLSATMPLCPCELNAAMPLSSGFLADVFYCYLEDGLPDPQVWERASALCEALPILIVLRGARRPSPLHDFGRSAVQQFLHGYWYTLGCSTCGCEQVIPRSVVDTRHIFSIKPPCIIGARVTLWAIWEVASTCHGDGAAKLCLPFGLNHRQLKRTEKTKACGTNLRRQDNRNFAHKLVAALPLFAPRQHMGALSRMSCLYPKCRAKMP